MRLSLINNKIAYPGSFSVSYKAWFQNKAEASLVGNNYFKNKELWQNLS